ncbi:MAG: radical SAM protein [Candidatus Edwardsbacteria bacterium]
MIHNIVDEMLSSLGAPLSVHFPSHIWVELIADCNIYCQMCRNTPTELHGRIDFALFRSLVDQVSPGVLNYSIFNWGETLLLKPREVEKYLDYLCLHKRKNARIYLFTNGTLLDNDRCSILMNHGVEIDVSVDGCSQNTFEKIRRGANFKSVISNIKNAIELHERKFPNAPQIGIHSTIQRDNIDELVGIAKMAHKLGLSRIGFGLVIEPSKFRIEFTEENVRKVEEAVNYSMDVGLFVTEKPMRIGEYYWQSQHYTRTPIEKFNTVCNAPNFLAAVNEVGEVSACCSWPGTLGDLKKESFRDIWHGNRFENLRSVVNTPRAPKACLKCTMANRI